MALHDVLLTLERGEAVGIAGPSGSGKSTLLQLIAGLNVPTAGTVTLCGHDLSACSRRERTELRRIHVGFVFQRFHLLPSLSARANVAVPLVQAGVSRRERQRRASTLLERVGLSDRASHRPEQLSGGERQRVAIARALVTDPDVVLADEPTGELDTDTGQHVLECLTSATRERGIILASHDQAALDAADRILRLRDGEVIDGE